MTTIRSGRSSRRQPALTRTTLPLLHTPPPTLHPPHQQRILAVSYRFPEHVALSPACLDLLSRIFVANPKQRITIEGVRAHPWRVTGCPCMSPPPPPFSHACSTFLA